MATLQLPSASQGVAQQLAGPQTCPARALSSVSAFPGKRLSKQARRKMAVTASVRAALPTVAMVAETSADTAMFAKEMERVAAKEALLLAIKDAGGPQALSAGPGNEASKIDVSEKLLALERLNPTPRPTTSPLFEGTWDFVWVGARSPGILAARILLTRFPPAVANLETLTLEISGETSKATALLKFFNTAETTVTLSTKLSVEGPLKLKEEYAEAVVSTPTVGSDSTPSALKPIVDQLSSAAASLPQAIKDALAAGLKVPLTGRFSREIVVSYLDEELLIVRDQSGLPDVLVRAAVSVLDAPDDAFTEDPADYNS